MIPRLSLLLAFMVLIFALPVHAQTGCTDSPESSTIVLAAVGGIGALAASVRAARASKPK